MRLIKKALVSFAFVLGFVPVFAQNVNSRAHVNNMSSDDYYSLNAGYKGFIELGYGIGVGNNEVNRIEIQTTHGYQINSCLFVGAGIGASVYHDGGDYLSLPIFADFRCNMPLSISKVSPFIDFKVGYSLVDVEGFFCIPSIGLRAPIDKRVGVNFTLGYELQRYGSDVEIPEYDFYYKGSGNAGAFVFKLGIDF